MLKKREVHNKVAICVFALPALILFTVFVIYPMLPQIVMSFQKHDGLTSQGFVKFDNYIKALKSPSFWVSFKNTWIVVFFSACVSIPISLIFALLMNSDNSFCKRFFKFAAVFPAVLSVTVIAQMWVAIYDPEWGLLNSVLEVLGLESWKHSWLTDKSTVITCISFAYLWQYIGINALILYTGIRSIPEQYFEAATIDGAGFWRASFYITVPLLTDVLKYVLVVSTMGSLAQFAHVRIMTAGGPGFTSRTMIYEMYYQAFTRSDYGVGSAVAVLFILQCLVVTFVINKVLHRDPTES